MKNDITTTFLNFVLALLIILCVIFAFMFLQRSHVVRQMQSRIQAVQFANARAQALARDAVVYNQTARNPDLARILQSALGTPAGNPPATK